MVQNTIRALPGSFSGGRSTIAEKSQRSRGSMAMAFSSIVLLYLLTFGAQESQPVIKCLRRSRLKDDGRWLVVVAILSQAGKPAQAAFRPQANEEHRRPAPVAAGRPNVLALQGP